MSAMGGKRTLALGVSKRRRVERVRRTVHEPNIAQADSKGGKVLQIPAYQVEPLFGGDLRLQEEHTEENGALSHAAFMVPS